MQPFTYSKVGAFNRYFNSLLILIKYDPSSLIKTNINGICYAVWKSNIIEKRKIYSMFASEWGYSTVCSAGTCTPCSILFETYIQDISYLILHVHLTWKYIPLRPIMWIQHKFPKKSEKTKHGSMFFLLTNKGVEFALSSFLFIEKSIWRKKERTRTKNITEQKGLFRCGTQWFFNIWLFYFLGSRSILKKVYNQKSDWGQCLFV